MRKLDMWMVGMGGFFGWGECAVVGVEEVSALGDERGGSVGEGSADEKDGFDGMQCLRGEGVESKRGVWNGA
jgi:hypothetical protein